jgi:hypothetical protein
VPPPPRPFERPPPPSCPAEEQVRRNIDRAAEAVSRRHGLGQGFWDCPDVERFLVSMAHGARAGVFPIPGSDSHKDTGVEGACYLPFGRCTWVKVREAKEVVRGG